MSFARQAIVPVSATPQTSATPVAPLAAVESDIAQVRALLKMGAEGGGRSVSLVAEW